MHTAKYHIHCNTIRIFRYITSLWAGSRPSLQMIATLVREFQVLLQVARYCRKESVLREMRLLLQWWSVAIIAMDSLFGLKLVFILTITIWNLLFSIYRSIANNVYNFIFIIAKISEIFCLQNTQNPWTRIVNIDNCQKSSDGISYRWL